MLTTTKAIMLCIAAGIRGLRRVLSNLLMHICFSLVKLTWLDSTATIPAALRQQRDSVSHSRLVHKLDISAEHNTVLLSSPFFADPKISTLHELSSPRNTISCMADCRAHQRIIQLAKRSSSIPSGFDRDVAFCHPRGTDYPINGTWGRNSGKLHKSPATKLQPLRSSKDRTSTTTKREIRVRIL
jgi:hypothetical protein